MGFEGWSSSVPSLQYGSVKIELDAKILVDYFTLDSCSSSCNLPLINDHRTPFSRIPQSRVKHCFREVNKCVDALIRRGAKLKQNFFFLLVSPTDIRMLRSLDALGVAPERHCASNVEPD